MMNNICIVGVVNTKPRLNALSCPKSAVCIITFKLIHMIGQVARWFLVYLFNVIISLLLSFTLTCGAICICILNYMHNISV